MSVIENELVSKFITYPNYFKKGAEFLANQFNCTSHEVREARARAKEIIKNGNQVNKDVYIGELEEKVARIIEEKRNDEDGNSTIIIESMKPLTPDEIDKLVSVDNITRYVSMTWLKSHKNGTWTYSIATKSLIKDFYNIKGLKEKIKTLLPDFTPVVLPVVDEKGTDSLIIYVSDIHAGAKNTALNIFGKDFNGEILKKRLLKVADEAISKGKVYNKVYILNLGDSLDGMDGFTVSRRHSLGSDSNKNQFDIFVDAMSSFYNRILTSGLSNTYTIWNCLNSNHDGSGLSYMGNKAVELYLEAKYPQVEFVQQEKFIDITNIENHHFAFTHGKDATLMKYPMKKYIDDKIDSFMQQYFQSNNINTTYHYCHLRRGDLHMYVHENCKFGDSLLVPSVYGTSDYIAINYGNSIPGAVLEEVNSEKRGTIITPIWLHEVS